jgi:ABC-type polysaccharide/polyol phosphate export permease
MSGGTEYAAQPVRAALKAQFRVIGALVMREVHMRYGRKNIGFLWLMFEPIMFAFAVISMRSVLPYSHNEHGIDLVSFLMTGYLPFLIFRNVQGRLMNVVRENHSVLYHRGVNLYDLYIARIIMETAGGLTAFVLGCAFLYLIGVMDAPKELAPIYVGLFLLTWFSAGFATLISAGAEYHTVIEKISHPLSYLSIIVSGCFFMVDWLPPAFRDVALLNPMVHCFELIREGYFGARVHVHYDVGYVAAFCLVQTFVAAVLVRNLRERVAVE